MTEWAHGASGTSAVLAVATLVTVAAALWWWLPSGGSSDGATVRRVMRPRGSEAQQSEQSEQSEQSDQPNPADPPSPGLPSGASEPSEREAASALAVGRMSTTQARPVVGNDVAGSWLRRRRRRRPVPTARGPTTDEVAGGMVLLAVALQSGCGVVEAIEAAAAVAPDAAGHELAVVAAALRWGVADDQAWGAVSPRWRRTSIALRLAAASGVAPSALLLSGAEDLRAARLAVVEVAAARLGVRLVGPLGLAFLPAFVLTTVVPVVVAVASQVLSP